MWVFIFGFVLFSYFQRFVLSRRGEIKSFVLGGVRFYSAFDMARIAELIQRPRRFRELMKMQGYMPSDKKQP